VRGCRGTTVRLEPQVRVTRTSAIHGPLHVAEDGDDVEDGLRSKEY
jgi:hypothetical protein